MPGGPRRRSRRGRTRLPGGSHRRGRSSEHGPGPGRCRHPSRRSRPRRRQRRAARCRPGPRAPSPARPGPASPRGRSRPGRRRRTCGRPRHDRRDAGQGFDGERCRRTYLAQGVGGFFPDLDVLVAESRVGQGGHAGLPIGAEGRKRLRGVVPDRRGRDPEGPARAIRLRPGPRDRPRRGRTRRSGGGRSRGPRASPCSTRRRPAWPRARSRPGASIAARRTPGSASARARASSGTDHSRVGADLAEGEAQACRTSASGSETRALPRAAEAVLASSPMLPSA